MMNALRKGLAVLLCVLMPLSLTGMAPADAAVYTETETHVHSEMDDHDNGADLLLSELAGESTVSQNDIVVPGTNAFAMSAGIAALSVSTVSLDAGNGTVGQATVNLNGDGTLPELPVPTRTGWNFVGWYTASVNENYWGDNEGETLEGLQAAHPDWTPEECKLRTFTWIIESTGEKVEAGSTLSEGVTTLYAMYEPTRVKVYWLYNGWRNQYGEFLRGEPQYGSPLTPANLTTNAFNWPGRTFEGWYDAPEGGTKWEFHDVNDYQCSDLVVTGDLYLYAHWSGGPAATSLRLAPLSQFVEPGSKVNISFSYSPIDANAPKVIWTSDSPFVTVESVSDRAVTLVIDQNADVTYGNKQVTITAQTEQGVTGTAQITVGHSWSSGRIIKASTCTEGGTVRYTCTKCGAIRDVDFPADGHYFTTLVVPATCTAEGYIDRTCRTCGLYQHEVTGAALGHSWSTTTVSGCSGTVTTKTCTTCGLTEVSSDPNAAAHVWETTPTVDKKPTCTSEGSQSYHCRNCDLTRDSEIIPADPSLHEWDDWQMTVEATETETGEETRVCAICGVEEKRTTKPTSSVIPDIEQPEQPGQPEQSDQFDQTVDITPVLSAPVADQKAAEEAVVKAVQKLLDSSATDSELALKIQEAVESGKDITAELSVKPVIAPEGAGEFEALFGDQILQYMEIDIEVKASGGGTAETLGYITETDEEIKLSVVLSGTGDGRIVRVLREHEGVIDFLSCQTEETTISFSTDRFSTFAIGSTNNIFYATVEDVPDQTYTGAAVTPTLNVTINGGEKLAEGTDYAVAYSDNVNVGTATAVITGLGDFAGSSTEVTFRIVKSGDNSDDESDGGTSPAAETGVVKSPKTGEETKLELWAVMLTLSGSLGLVMTRKKKADR